MQSEPKCVETPIVSRANGESRMDLVSIEEPLEIWLAYTDESGEAVDFSLSITMRTPGDDKALVVGFLFAEGIILKQSDIVNIEFFGPVTEPHALQNQIKVSLKSGERLAENRYQRYFYSNSSCGVCGKSSIQALEMLHQPCIKQHGFTISDKMLRQLPDKLRASQQEFRRTGGLHGVALIGNGGELLYVMEDIGRHNAMDKLMGHLILNDLMQTNDKMVLVSGRASYELLQKSLMADIPAFASIGAPSSAAVDLARSFGTTLIGFLGKDNYNVYHKAHRIVDF